MLPVRLLDSAPPPRRILRMLLLGLLVAVRCNYWLLLWEVSLLGLVGVIGGSEDTLVLLLPIYVLLSIYISALNICLLLNA